MMKKEIKLSDAIGKALDGFDFSTTCGQAVLSFSDGTFTTLEIGGYDCSSEEIEEGTLNLFDFGDDKLIGLEIISKDELETKRRQKYEEEVRLREQRDLMEFERLKRKFE